jgi:CheY-like chemotaxis protein
VSGRILVVDDSATILKVVSAILERRGFAASTARDGAAGLNKLRVEGPFDLVLVDFVMPKMNGFQFCRELRRDPSSKHLPVILMSAKSDRIRQQFVEQTGALDAISKPFDARSLVAVIEGVLAKVKSGRAPLTLDLETLDEEAISEREAPPSMAPDKVASEAVPALARYLASSLVKGAPSGFERSTEVLREALLEAPKSLLQSAFAALSGRDGRPILSGDMAHVSLAEVMQVLQMQKQSGSLFLATAGRSVTLYFRDGLVDLGQSESEKNEFRLGRYFVEAGHVSRKEVEAFAKSSRERNRKIGDELVAAGKISETARTEALVRQTSEVVYDLVRWQTGSFWFIHEPASEEAVAAKLGLGVPGLIFEGFRRVDEWRLMEGKILWDNVMSVDEATLKPLSDSLTRPERMVIAAVDGVRTVTEIVNECDLAHFDALKVLYQLQGSRVLRPVVQPGRRSEAGRPVDEGTTEHGDATEA